MFENLSDRLGGVFDRLTKQGALSEDDVTAAMREVRVALLEADVSLPVANQPQIPQEDRVTVSIRADGRVFIADQPVNVALLEDRLRGLTSGRPDTVVYLRADEGLRYGEVIRVVDVIKRAGIVRIGFVYALPEEKGR